LGLREAVEARVRKQLRVREGVEVRAREAAKGEGRGGGDRKHPRVRQKLLNRPPGSHTKVAQLAAGGTMKNILVFDLGGGTFDVSLLTVNNGNPAMLPD